MKKIFILSILIAPIAAYATGPAGINDGFDGDWVGADDGAPYETATIENGDSTTVVSASYVKGAYNDAIAAINTVANDVNDLNDLYDLTDNISNSLDEKQNQLYLSGNSDTYISSAVIEDFGTLNNMPRGSARTILINAIGVKDAIGVVDTTIANKRINAVTTWGNDTPTQLELSSLPAQP